MTQVRIRHGWPGSVRDVRDVAEGRLPPHRLKAEEYAARLTQEERAQLRAALRGDVLAEETA